MARSRESNSSLEEVSDSQRDPLAEGLETLRSHIQHRLAEVQSLIMEVRSLTQEALGEVGRADA
jgi:hypothetical protein